MTNLPEEQRPEPLAAQGNEPHPAVPAQPLHLPEPPDEVYSPWAQPTYPTDPTPPSLDIAPSNTEPPFFYSFTRPPVRPPVRIPHFGHLLLLALILVVSFFVILAGAGLAMHFYHIDWRQSAQYATDLRLNLLGEAVLYLITFGFSLIVFPTIWNESLFEGLEWHVTVVRTRFWLLFGTASVCFGLAILDQVLMPGPSSAPIEKMISTPGAAWLMFAFGITMAPFFEEMFFRGFLLPALATACDWLAESIQGAPPRPLNATGHPLWSVTAMVIASFATSIPFALLHVAQQGHALGPFLLLILVSLVLCAVRLLTRSLAASTLVHSTYNFLIFFLTMVGTSGFRHFDKM